MTLQVQRDQPRSWWEFGKKTLVPVAVVAAVAAVAVGVRSMQSEPSSHAPPGDALSSWRSWLPSCASAYSPEQALLSGVCTFVYRKAMQWAIEDLCHAEEWPSWIPTAPDLHEFSPSPLVLGNSITLEDAFLRSDYALSQSQFESESPFTSYFVPNEQFVAKIQPYLQMPAPGLLVSAGGPRSFFDLILCVLNSPENCQGLVVRDINPRMIAYTNFLTLLLRLTEDRRDFVLLSASTRGKHVADKINCIRNRLKNSDLPDSVQSYYERLLTVGAKAYYESLDFDYEGCLFSSFCGTSWVSDPSRFINYYHNDTYFQILQNYAKNGKIISTLGDIGDLRFLDELSPLPVRLIDSSNIHDYQEIKLHMDLKESVRLIWTYPANDHSTIYKFKDIPAAHYVDKEVLPRGADRPHNFRFHS